MKTRDEKGVQKDCNIHVHVHFGPDTPAEFQDLVGETLSVTVPKGTTVGEVLRLAARQWRHNAAQQRRQKSSRGKK